ncbi:unnamed protein product [Scytosiphon promiscuus]
MRRVPEAFHPWMPFPRYLSGHRTLTFVASIWCTQPFFVQLMNYHRTGTTESALGSRSQVPLARVLSTTCSRVSCVHSSGWMNSDSHRENAHERQARFLALKLVHPPQTVVEAVARLRLVLRSHLGQRKLGRVFVVEVVPLGEKVGWRVWLWRRYKLSDVRPSVAYLFCFRMNCFGM